MSIAKRSGLDFVGHCIANPLDLRVDPTAEIVCFRVVQEALTNIARHAQAKQVWVDLQRREQALFLLIRDDGIGFDVPHGARASESRGKFRITRQCKNVSSWPEVSLRSVPPPGMALRFTSAFPCPQTDRHHTTVSSHSTANLLMKTKPIRVLLADDHALFRAGVRMLLEHMEGVEVVGEAADGREAVRVTKQLQPDVVLMDITMTGLNGLEATAQVTQECPQARVIILSMHLNEQYVMQAVRAGASGYLLKDAAATELEQAVRTVARGDVYSTRRCHNIFLLIIDDVSVQRNRE